jgi:hypothetical protein
VGKKNKPIFDDYEPIGVDGSWPDDVVPSDGSLAPERRLIPLGGLPDRHAPNINARDELLFFLEASNKKLKCAQIWFSPQENQPPAFINLPVGFGESRFLEFQREINRSYHNGHTPQELFGVLWFVDGTWADRYVYDGSEEWMLREIPAIPSELLNR